MSERKYCLRADEMLPGIGATTMMIEDFAGTEHCIERLQTAVYRGLTVQAHAGDLADGDPSGKNTCKLGDTNALAAFLLGAGEYSYYHCAPGWSSVSGFPAVSDYWLDWLPVYDKKLGEPRGLGAKGADGMWRRSFASGTRVTFDPKTSAGTITCESQHSCIELKITARTDLKPALRVGADGTVDRGDAVNESRRQLQVAHAGCAWAT